MPHQSKLDSVWRRECSFRDLAHTNSDQKFSNQNLVKISRAQMSTLGK